MAFVVEEVFIERSLTVTQDLGLCGLITTTNEHKVPIQARFCMC